MIFNINIDTLNIETPFPQQCSRHVTYHLIDAQTDRHACS